PENNPAVRETRAKFLAADSSLQSQFDDAYGFAIYPKVGKAAIGIGGAGGDGLVYEQGRLIGTSRLSQATIGLQLGGEKYSEVIFFRDAGVLAQFKKGKWRASAQASAVIAKDGSGKKSSYRGGVKIFITGVEGAMAEASVGGQRFTFVPN
ncbi:MAG: hypothetical protein OER88_13635, partial [Planctomycetota bacterium]|nr:hypothetical protein [Planctomycetota bacterium]